MDWVNSWAEISGSIATVAALGWSAVLLFRKGRFDGKAIDELHVELEDLNNENKVLQTQLARTLEKKAKDWHDQGKKGAKAEYVDSSLGLLETQVASVRRSIDVLLERTKGLERHQNDALLPDLTPREWFQLMVRSMTSADDQGEPVLVLGISYLRDGSRRDYQQVWEKARKVLELLSLEVVRDGPEEFGSVWKRWLFRATKSTAKALMEGGAAAATDTYVRRPGAEATGDLAKAIAELMTAMGDREGVHFFDNLVVGQFRGKDGNLRSFSRELSAADRTIIRHLSPLMLDPVELMTKLAESDAASGSLITEGEGQVVTSVSAEQHLSE